MIVATLLAFGCGQERDAIEAFNRGDYGRSFRAARALAEEDDPAAVNFVGVHYYLGAGVVRDFREAERWFGRAARLGNANAQRNLGTLYLRGLGVHRDNFLAYAWFTAAATRGSRRATAYIATMSDLLTPSQMVDARHVLDREIRQRTAD